MMVCMVHMPVVKQPARGQVSTDVLHAIRSRLEAIGTAAARLACDETLDPERFGRADAASAAYAYAARLLENLGA